MIVLSKDQWVKVMSLPTEFLSTELKESLKRFRPIILKYIEGSPIEYHDGKRWSRVYTPSFDCKWVYRVYAPTMTFTVDLQKDEAEAIQRVFDGAGLNSEERRVVMALGEEFKKQFKKVFE
ncbi:hypothetical protein HWC29_gp062 [Aeromonas phage 4_4572]|uniref:Uncharacterized protein n=1 Tax=Aeromonas phage 4_4572 TaxID=2588517 RepID=A0A5B9N5A8_9CAUD|nr:hypothetical protein HWC29_gp062 [Aeromonas phage 4_4572]QEG09124.1 hypothetical protein [Aeromonas phage 4_4572]